jgi:hypothetical protein
VRIRLTQVFILDITYDIRLKSVSSQLLLLSLFLSDPVMVTMQHMDDSFEVFGGTIDPAKHFTDLGNRIDLGSFNERPTRIRLTLLVARARYRPDSDRRRGLRRTPNPRMVHPNGSGLVPLVERGFN